MSEPKIVEGAAVCLTPAFWKSVFTRGRSSVELLTHYNCGRCDKWFSIGDAPSDRTRWTCPWCGLEQEFDPVIPEEIVSVKTDTMDT